MSIFLSTAEFDRLLEELDELFPDQFPDYQLSEKEISFRAGQVSVVRFLKEKLSSEN
jgi:hypothetical protein